MLVLKLQVGDGLPQSEGTAGNVRGPSCLTLEAMPCAEQGDPLRTGLVAPTALACPATLLN